MIRKLLTFRVKKPILFCYSVDKFDYCAGCNVSPRRGEINLTR